MAQAATASTDELLSQLAASEIDRLLAEADGNPAPPESKAKVEAAAAVADAPAAKEAEPAKEASAAPSTAANSETLTEGSERAALLQAAGFDSAQPAATAPAAPAPAAPEEAERAALLQAAGFETPAAPASTGGALEEVQESPIGHGPEHTPFYLKPLIWINAPLDDYPAIVRQIMGKVGIVTLLNALAVLTYVFFFRKH